MKLSKKQLIANAIFCLTLLGVIIWAIYAEYDRPWKKYRKEKIQQVWLQELGETDRCVTCHQGTDNPSFIDKPQPYRTHSGRYLKQHPVDRFGCISCHDGQGAALTVEDAHGESEKWNRPILRGRYAQSSCGRCHAPDQTLPLNIELPGAPSFVKGWGLFKEYNCIGCHKLFPYRKPDRIGPSLSSLGSKVSREWFVKWLKDPKGYLPAGKMPRFNLGDKEIGYMADYLTGNKNNPSLFLPLDKGGIGEVNEGQTLVSSLGCPGCHMINGAGNSFAPDLSNIGNKTNSGWVTGYLKDPRSYDNNSAMPKPAAEDNEIQSITAYLMSLKTPSFTSPSESSRTHLTKGGGREEDRTMPESIAAGEKLVRDLGCAGCHEISNIPSGNTGPDLDGVGEKRTDEIFFSDIPAAKRDLINWLLTKVGNPGKFTSGKVIARMPDYGFNEEQTESLAVFLLSLGKEMPPVKYVKTLIDPDKPESRGPGIIGKYNCLGCHKINNTGGNIAPDLTEEAKKSRPEWLFGFLKGPHKIRPPQIMKANMPNFNLSDKEIYGIIEYLAFVSGEPYPYNPEPRKEIPSEDIWYGEKLYREVFACSACHTIDKQGGEVGPDHTDLASRLKRPWIERWLRDPQSIKPDVRMPKFKFRDWEFEALTNYMMTLGQYRFVKVKVQD